MAGTIKTSTNEATLRLIEVAGCYIWRGQCRNCIGFGPTGQTAGDILTAVLDHECPRDQLNGDD